MQPGQGDAGGMNVYVRHLAESLAGRGHDVDLITLWRAAEHPGEDAPKDPVSITPLEKGDGPEADPKLRLVTVTLPETTHVDKNGLADQLTPVTDALAAAYRTGLLTPPDVLHGHYWLSAAVAGHLAQALHVPLVATFHTTARAKNARSGTDENPEPVARERGEQAIIDRAAAVVTNTEAERKDLSTLYQADPTRLHVIPPGVDTAVFHPASNTQKTERPFTIGFAGRLQSLKGPQILVEALALLGRGPDPVDARLWLAGVGSPEFTRTLKDRIQQLGLNDAVEQLGSVPVHELAQGFRTCDVVAVPSSSETFGLVALEAQACGTPVVATDVDGLRIAVDDGETGWLVPDRSPATWAHVFRQIAANPSERTRRGRNAAERAQGFSWEANAQAHEALYRGLLA